MPEFSPKDEVSRYCAFVQHKLRLLGYEVLAPFEREKYCSIHFRHPKISEMVEDILKREGTTYPEERAWWTVGGNIVARYNEESNIFRVEGELPITLIPDGFRRCSIPAFHRKYTTMEITQIHAHAYKGHGAVHIHFEAEILDPDQRSIDRLFEETEKLLENMEDCNRSLMPGED